MPIGNVLPLVTLQTHTKLCLKVESSLTYCNMPRHATALCPRRCGVATDGPGPPNDPTTHSAGPWSRAAARIRSGQRRRSKARAGLVRGSFGDYAGLITDRACAMQQVDDAIMLDHHAFGRARRARRAHHKGRREFPSTKN